MAITIITEPNDIAPVYSDISYVLSSTNYTQTNFKFVAVVKDSGGNTIAKLKAPIFYGTTDKGVFNLSRILQNYVTYDFNTATTTTAKCANSLVLYSVEFGEEYGGAEYLNLPNGDYKFKVNSSNEDGTWKTDYTTLNIKIKPSFWLTFPAVLIYLILLSLLVFLISTITKKQVDRKNKEI